MKNIAKKAILLFSIVPFLWSCNLNRESPDLLDLEIKNIEKARLWDNGMMATLRPRLFGSSVVLPQEAQADMLNAHIVSSVGSFTQFHAWEPLRSSNDIISNLYLSYYSALADVNVFLDAAPSIKTNSQTEKDEVRHISGHAHFMRAFYYFNLTMRWGAVYNKKKASSDLSVPFFDSYTPLEMRARATNEKVWNAILSDLDSSIKELEDVPGKEGSTIITGDVPKALKARVLLYMGDYSNALKVAQELIDGGSYPLIPKTENQTEDIKNFREMWNGDSGMEQIFQPYVDKPDEVGDVLNLYGADLIFTEEKAKKSKNPVAYNRPSYLPSMWVVNLYESRDRRRDVYFEQQYTAQNEDNVSKEKVWVISKFKGNEKYKTYESKYWGGYVPNSIQAPKPFRIAEQYLIAAEAAYKELNTAEALKYLNMLRASRGLPDQSDLNLEDKIREERMRELAFEGFRLWDLRRWNMPMKRRDPQVPAFLKKDISIDIVREANDPKFIWPIPAKLFKINKNLDGQQNPGWN